MSILIKDVKMPSGCFDCGFRDKTWDECKCPPTKGYSILSCLEHDKRASFCPLVGLPEKHGRLIDADALGDKMSGKWTVYDYQALGAMPTIVEAEGE